MNISLPLFIIQFIGNFAALFISETTLLTKKLSKKRELIYFLSLLLLLFSALTMQLNMYIVIFCSITILGLLSEHKMTTVIFATLGYITSVLTDYILMMIYFKIMGINEEILLSSIPYSVIFYSCLMPLLYLLLSGIKKIFQLIPFDLSSCSPLALIAMLIYLFICALIYIINFTYEQNQNFPSELVHNNLKLFFLFFLMTSIFLSTIIFLIYKNLQNREKLKEAEHLKKYTTEIETLYNNIRSFKHDYINILLSMSEYLNTNDLTGLKQYYEANILKTSNAFEAENPALEQLTKLQVSNIKGVLYFKILEAADKNILTHLEIINTIRQINFDPVDLSRILGIFFDNAAEAAEEYEDEKRFIRISLIQQEDSLTIIFGNYTAMENMSINRSRQQGFTTKSGEHGTGLFNVSNILHKYDNTYLTTQITNHIFSQILLIEENVHA